jgi:hypothetical protein
MSNILPKEFGKRPEGHGVTPAKWRQWEKDYDALPVAQHSLPGMPSVRVPKTAVAKEIYVAGAWVQFQLEKLGVSNDEIQQACCDVGTSAFLVVQEGQGMRFYPQDLWGAAQKLARFEPEP